MDCIKHCKSVYVKICMYTHTHTCTRLSLHVCLKRMSISVCVFEGATDISSGSPMKNEVTWLSPVFEGQGDPLAYSLARRVFACVCVCVFYFLHVTVFSVYSSASMMSVCLGSMAFNCFFLSCGRKCQQLLIRWRDGRREREDGKTEGVQKRKRERQCGRQEGNVTRQGGDMEHRITV